MAVGAYGGDVDSDDLIDFWNEYHDEYGELDRDIFTLNDTIDLIEILKAIEEAYTKLNTQYIDSHNINSERFNFAKMKEQIKNHLLFLEKVNNKKLKL